MYLREVVFPLVVNRNPYTLPTRKKAITTISSSYVRSLVRNLSEAQGSSVENEVAPPHVQYQERIRAGG